MTPDASHPPSGDLLQLLAHPDASCRRQAILAMAEQFKQQESPQWMMALVSHVLTEPDPHVATLCVQMLGRLKVYSAVDVLVSVMQGDTSLGVFKASLSEELGLALRRAAVQALGQIGDTRIIPRLMKLMNNKRENYRLRLAAAESLGRLGDPNATRPLVDVLTDEQENSLYLRESAAKALGMLGDIRALEALIDVLESKQGFKSKFNFLREQVIEAIGNIGRRNHRALDNLYLALGDEAPSIRLAAVQALERLGDNSSLSPLFAMLSDPEDDIAVAAASAIYHLGGEAAIREALAQDNLAQFIRSELEAYLP